MSCWAVLVASHSHFWLYLYTNGWLWSGAGQQAGWPWESKSLAGKLIEHNKYTSCRQTRTVALVVTEGGLSLVQYFFFFSSGTAKLCWYTDWARCTLFSDAWRSHGCKLVFDLYWIARLGKKWALLFYQNTVLVWELNLGIFWGKMVKSCTDCVKELLGCGRNSSASC